MVVKTGQETWMVKTGDMEGEDRRHDGEKDTWCYRSGGRKKDPWCYRRQENEQWEAHRQTSWEARELIFGKEKERTRRCGDCIDSQIFKNFPLLPWYWARMDEENAGFKTKAMREQEARAKAEAFGSVPVRVHLPAGKLVLQAAFAATETIGALQ
eukprot:scaffold23262_cov19-Tisochrysis_lutea.AAC.1